MNKSIEKFISYLEETYDNLEKMKNDSEIKQIKKFGNRILVAIKSIVPQDFKMITNFQTEITNLLRMIRTPKEDLKNIKEIFNEFPILCDYIYSSNLNNHEVYEVISFFINRNINSSIGDDAITIDMEALKKLQFNTMDTDELIEMIMTGETNLFFESNQEKFPKLKKEQIAEFNKRLPEFTRDITKSRKYNLDFTKYITNKMPNILIEDIVEAVIALKGLNCNQYVVDKIVLYLLNVYEKNLKNQKEIMPIDLNDVYLDILFPLTIDENGKYVRDVMYTQHMYYKNLIINHNRELEKTEQPEPKKKVVSKKYLTEKEVRDLNKYVRQFYNLYSAELIAIPNYEELLEVIANMEKLEVDSRGINRFLTYLITSPDLPDDYISTEKELLTIVNKLIKYNVSVIYIEAFIRKYRDNFRKTYDNVIDEYLGRIDEIKFYDQSIEKNITDLYVESLSASKEDYKIIVSMMQEYLDMLKKYSYSVEYEYNLAKNLK